VVYVVKMALIKIVAFVTFHLDSYNWHFSRSRWGTPNLRHLKLKGLKYTYHFWIYI